MNDCKLYKCIYMYIYIRTREKGTTLKVLRSKRRVRIADFKTTQWMKKKRLSVNSSLPRGNRLCVLFAEFEP